MPHTITTLIKLELEYHYKNASSADIIGSPLTYFCIPLLLKNIHNNFSNLMLLLSLALNIIFISFLK